jgi:hypothetical protein
MRAIAAPILLLAALCLTACGSSGDSTESSTTSTAPATPTPTKTTSRSAAEATRTPPRGEQLAAERRRAGNASAFVHPGIDNSVPTFGTESSAPQRQQAETVVRDFLVARAGGDWARACQQLAASTVKGLAKLGGPGKEACSQVLSALTTETRNPLEGPLVALRVKGKNSFALFVGREGQQYIVPMVREADGWRWTQSTPIPYPPAAGSPG